MPSRRRRSWNKEGAARQGGLTVPQMRRRKARPRLRTGTDRTCKHCGLENSPPWIAYDSGMLRLFAYCNECGTTIGEVPRTKEWDEVHWGQRFR